jgi:alpha-glucosidase
MTSENTQYGLKNKLSFSDFSQINENHLQIKLSKEHKKDVYLNIVFVNENTVRFHYRFEKNFDELKPNANLNFTQEKTKISIEKNPDFYLLKTKNFDIKIDFKPLATIIYDKDKNIISADFPQLGFWSAELDDLSNQEIRIYRAYGNSAPLIYGLGDKTGAINRWQQRFRNEPIDALGFNSKNTDPMYKDIPFFIHLDSETQIAHGIFFDNFYKKTFDFGKEKKPGNYYYMSAEKGEANFYFFYGPSIKKVVSNYLKLTGMPCEMPDCALGYIASGMSYLENYNQEQEQGKKIIETLTRFQEKNFSTTAFHLSSGYILDENNKRQQFIWNKNKIKDPKVFAEELKKLGIEISCNLKPVLLTSHPEYQEACKQDLFINDKNGQSLVIDFWGGQGSYLDFHKTQTQTWWQKKLDELFSLDVTGIWNDNNEFEIFDTFQGEENKALQANIMNKLAYEQALKRGFTKPWILTRSGYSGIQQYAQTWIGDNQSSWESLKYDNAILTSMSLSGLVHCGTDIGGFYGKTPDAELLLRWIQCGVFTPRFSIHSYKEQATEADMYEKSHPEIFKHIQQSFALRKELLAYIKTEQKKAFALGIPIMRPLVYDFQNDKNILEESFNYMFGEQYLVCPIFNQDPVKEIYLPCQKSRWQHLFTQEQFQGGNYYSLENKLDYIHVFRRC